MSERVHLLDLRLRVSAAGNRYLSGWLGKAAVVGFLDREADGEVWQIFVSTPTPRPAGGDVARPGRSTPSRRNRGRPLSSDELNDSVDDLARDNHERPSS